MYHKLRIIFKLASLFFIVFIGISFGNSINTFQTIISQKILFSFIVFIGPSIGFYLFIKLFGYKNLNKPNIFGRIFGRKNFLNLILFLGYIVISFCLGLIISGILYNFNQIKCFIITISILFGLGCIISTYLLNYILKNK